METQHLLNPRTPKTTASCVRRLICLLAILSSILLLPVDTAAARDVPFPLEWTVDGNFDGARSVHTADMDGDGDLDVLGAAIWAGEITWWENIYGVGTVWTEHIVDGSFDGALSVYAADMDRDGDMDVLGAAYVADDIAWWENTNGTGTSWTEHTVDEDFDWVVALHAADVDGDGDMDVLAAADDANTITWWENLNGVGTSWTERTVDGYFDCAVSVYAADVDGDGDIDVLGAAFDADNISWWENADGDGTVWTEHTVAFIFDGANSVHAADVDGDGDIDVLGTAGNAAAIAWWENTDGSGTLWAARTVGTNFDGARAVYAADMDGDGDLDILGAASSADDVTWWENVNGTGGAWSEHLVEGNFDGVTSIYAADVDGDGDLDVLGAAEYADDIAWWENATIHRSATYPTEHTVDEYFYGANSIHAADVDHDGDMDILGTAWSAGEIAWWDNTGGDGTTWSEHTVDGHFGNAMSVCAADVDGDSDMDVLGAAVSDDDITWWENADGAGTAWSEHTVDGAFDGAWSVYAADLDSDGDLDVLGAAYLADAIAWWENTTGDGTAWTGHTVDGEFDGARSVYAADVDGDGDQDVLAAADVDDVITWWENTNRDGTAWIEHTVDADCAAHSIYADDVDGDGDMDVLGAAGFDGIAWWENTDGTGTSWSEHTVDGHFDGARSVYATDLDSDGDLDVLGAAGTANAIAWWENTPGDGTAWTEHTVDGYFDSAESAYAADVDGHGDLDVLGAASTANDIAWWENRGGQFALSTDSTAPSKIVSGKMDDMLRITMTHRGRADDTDMELATLDLLFEESAGDPLTNAEADAIIENLHIYLDDGSTTFEGDADTLVTTIPGTSVQAGRQTITFSDGNWRLQVIYSVPRTYFLVVEPAPDAYLRTPSQFRVTHLTQASSTAQDRVHDLSLLLEYVSNVSSGITTAIMPPVYDAYVPLVLRNHR